MFVNDIAQYAANDGRFVECPNAVTTFAQSVWLNTADTHCARGRYVHIALPGSGRILHICEVRHWAPL